MENFISHERYDFALCVFSVLTYLTDEQTLNKALSNLKECLHSGGLVLMDIPLLGAFKGLTYKSETLHRDVIVDKQNENDKKYVKMSENFEQSSAFKTACDLVFKGKEQPSGYTEPLLHLNRLKKKN